MKQAEGIPTPKSAVINPIPSRRTQKSVSFEKTDKDSSLKSPLLEQYHGSSNERKISQNSLNLNEADQNAGFSPNSEIRNLKAMIARLTSELSKLLADSALQDHEVQIGKKLLPEKGPIPKWLTEDSALHVVMAAMEQQLWQKAEVPLRCEAQIEALQLEVMDVERENQRLQIRLTEPDNATVDSDSQLLTEQARLVLDENQIMTQQLSLQHERFKIANRNRVNEVCRLRNRKEELESESSELRGEAERIRLKLHEMKDKYHSLIMNSDDEDQDSVQRADAINGHLHQLRDRHRCEIAEIMQQLQAADRERARITESLTDASAERDLLSSEVMQLRHSLQSKHKDSLLLEKFAKKHRTLQEYLDSVVSAANDLQIERDSYQEALELRESEFNRLILILTDELHLVTPDAELNLQQEKPGIVKLEKLVNRLLQLVKHSEAQSQEANMRVRYLQSLVHQQSRQLQLTLHDRLEFDKNLETALKNAMDE